MQIGQKKSPLIHRLEGFPHSRLVNPRIFESNGSWRGTNRFGTEDNTSARFFGIKRDWIYGRFVLIAHLSVFWETNVYGCGGFLVVNGERYVLQASSSDTEMAEMRNVAGEILGSTLAIKKAIELGLPEITIYYDYFGIEKWATNEWKANKEGTKKYKSFIEESRKKIKINFKKVAGHSGIDGNEEADKLAKQAVGVK